MLRKHKMIAEAKRELFKDMELRAQLKDMREKIALLKIVDPLNPQLVRLQLQFEAHVKSIQSYGIDINNFLNV